VKQARELVMAFCEQMEVIVVDQATGQPTGGRFSLDCQAMTPADYVELAGRLEGVLSAHNRPR
jgi:hypothetical protein